MGFHRLGQPAVSRAPVVEIITVTVAAEDLGFVERSQDPFGIETDCINPGGHDVIASCGEIVCGHCARVFWR